MAHDKKVWRRVYWNILFISKLSTYFLYDQTSLWSPVTTTCWLGSVPKRTLMMLRDKIFSAQTACVSNITQKMEKKHKKSHFYSFLFLGESFIHLGYAKFSIKLDFLPKAASNEWKFEQSNSIIYHELTK